jgi:hypothetical protein
MHKPFEEIPEGVEEPGDVDQKGFPHLLLVVGCEIRDGG